MPDRVDIPPICGRSSGNLPWRMKWRAIRNILRNEPVAVGITLSERAIQERVRYYALTVERDA